MAAIVRELYDPHLKCFGLHRSSKETVHPNIGMHYELDPSLGGGFFWMYPVDNSFGISICDLTYTSELVAEFPYPPFLFFGQYTVPKNMPLDGIPIWHSGGVMGYMADQDGSHVRLTKDVPVRGVGLTLTKEFCDTEFSFQGEKGFYGLGSILERLGASPCIPEALATLAQVKRFCPTTSGARLYYKSKMLELVSYLLHWGEKSLCFFEKPIAEADLSQLHTVTRYLDKNFSSSILLDHLALLGCMSRSKLTTRFKQVYGLTIKEYIQGLRVEKGKQMLLDSDWKIEAIAHEVGYRNHASFTEIFKRKTGVTPRAFRDGCTLVACD